MVDRAVSSAMIMGWRRRVCPVPETGGIVLLVVNFSFLMNVRKNQCLGRQLNGWPVRV